MNGNFVSQNSHSFKMPPALAGGNKKNQMNRLQPK